MSEWRSRPIRPLRAPHFPALPPYEIPHVDRDLAKIGLNFGTIAPVLQRCTRCAHLFVPQRMNGPNVRMRTWCGECADLKRRVPVGD